MKRKLIFILALLTTGCGCVQVPNQWAEPVRTVTVTIVINKYQGQLDCINAGGTWVTGSTKDISNALVGCIEAPTKP